MFFEKHGMEENLFNFFSLKNYCFPRHFHRAYELIFIDDGHLFVSIDQKEYLLKKNDFVFIFNNQIHEFKTIDYSEITVVIFSPELIGDFFMKFKGLVPNDNILHFDGKLELKKLKLVYNQKSFLYAICAELVNKTFFVPIRQSSQTKIFYKILLYVEKNYSTNCTLKTVAKYLKYDYCYLSKLFTSLMHMSFTDYLNHYRISQACYLIKNTNEPIGQIAINCGYDNLRTFHRNFRKIVNHSPKEYRVLN